MRRKGAIVAVVGLALLSAGCNTDGTYLREGAGTEVATTDIVSVTNIQEIYFGEVCRQAGLSVRQAADGVILCDEAMMAPGAWTLFVQAGMNDIDRRCDAYLAWLDDRRRWREPILKQLHSTAAVTAAIMGLTGVSAVPIAIVGAAFGFAQETFVNISGRLVTEVNQSTVQSLVLMRQNDYRAGIARKAIANRPAALYALRSYLRICMPMTIETEINTTVTAIERNDMVPRRMITPATVTGAIVTSARAPLPKDFRPSDEAIRERRNAVLDLALCVAVTGQTQPAAIRDFLLGARRDPQSSPTSFLNQAVSVVGDCARSPYLNAFEVGRYGVADANVRAKDLADLRQALADQLGRQVPNTNDLSQLRPLIREARQKLGLPPGKGEIDLPLLRQLGS